MRITPLINLYKRNNNKAKNTQTGFVRNTAPLRTDQSCETFGHHKYTGVASADLAYASLKDNSIAQALKLMELI